jgi:predicted nucleic acid-binding Zn ribbon protein
MHRPPRETSRHFTKAHSHSLPPHPMLEGNDPITVAVAFVAGQIDGPGKILQLHARCSDGYCSTCRVRPVRWPCPAAAIALLALEMTKADRDSNTQADSPRGHRS